jgi:uncharacterized cupin superfamily protein
MKEIVRLDASAPVRERAKYPAEMVVADAGGFDGSYLQTTSFVSGDRKVLAGLWESGPGTLQTDGYPHHEVCFVLEGRVVVTNRGGGREEFAPGDSFVIPKGWAGTWHMPVRFKKQFVSFEAAP